MDFSFTPEQEHLRDVARGLAIREIAPLSLKMEERANIPSHLILIRKMAGLGFILLKFP